MAKYSNRAKKSHELNTEQAKMVRIPQTARGMRRQLRPRSIKFAKRIDLAEEKFATAPSDRTVKVGFQSFSANC